MPTLLVVDDEPSILHFFRRAFCEPEVTLLTASSATEGVETVIRDRPDVVILDIDLPERGLRRGDIGVVVLIHPDEAGYESNS